LVLAINYCYLQFAQTDLLISSPVKKTAT